MIAALLIGEYSAAAIVAFMMMFGEMLENFTMARANDALKNLARLIPNVVTLLRDGQPTALAIEQVRVGDTLLVRNGERLPVDGVDPERASRARRIHDHWGSRAGGQKARRYCFRRDDEHRRHS